MSFELGEAIRRCGLETGARRAVLDALACYTDVETGLARVSRVSVAVHAGIVEKTAQRVLNDLCSDVELAGLVRRVREASGRGNPAVYRVDIARLEALSDAMKAAGRRVFAGVGKRLSDAGMIGRKASPENVRAVFTELTELLREEDQPVVRRLVESHRAAFEAALARSREVEVIGMKVVPGGPDVPPLAPVDKPVEGANKGGHSVPVSGAERGTSRPERGTFRPTPYNKDSSPSGNITLAREALPVEKILASQACAIGDCVFSVEGLLAHATLNRRERIELVDALHGRMMRVSPAGLLAIRAYDAKDAAEVEARWLEPLVSWAGSVGLSGVVIDAAFAPKDAMTAAEASA
tara:strand:- start:36743 stop:37795 length:1053 start_codon:yes stop_codon:yes gene_type:complete